MPTPAEIKERIPHTWPLFFRKHGRFTPIQQQTIPHILDGRDLLAVAATASGKTEAVIAPLVERHWVALHRSVTTLLYICPTRSLVRDLYERLQPVLAEANITVGLKTGDTPALNPKRPFAILITTPESTDSLLTRAPRLFANLQAIVLDEIHLFDDTPRGDHLRCLLPRIARIRQYAQLQALPLQRIALSATVPNPAGVAARYLHNAIICQITAGREIVAEIVPLYDLAELARALTQRASQKTLLFCNSRQEVEQTAAFLRQHLAYHAEIFVHYSNLDGQMRHEVESRFAAAAVAICVATSTLELGIDIGSVDDVVLLGAPHTLTAFLQRIGRGGRRTGQTQVLCLPKLPEEWVRFEALLLLARQGAPVSFEDMGKNARPSVLVQQTFSLLKQSPTGALRLGDLRRVAPSSISNDTLRAILGELQVQGYLQPGRLGEWRPDFELQTLFDQHQIYSNIGGDLLAKTAVDAYTGRVLAQTERQPEIGRVVLFGGQPMRVVWQEKNRFGLAPAQQATVDELLRFQTSAPVVPFDVAQAVAQVVDQQTGELPYLAQGDDMVLFHFWGTVWGELLTAVLREQRLLVESINGYCLRLQLPITTLPLWEQERGQRAVKTIVETLANRLEMGRFHGLLPRRVAQTAVVQQLNLAQFAELYQAARLVAKNELNEQLQMLL